MHWINPERTGNVVTRRFLVSAERPLAFLRQCPAHAPTPLQELTGLARQCGVGALFAKDETRRMGLGSFKALGAAFAVASMIADAVGTEDLESNAAREAARSMTFITASAGNHGLSLAAGARVFGAHAVIVLSEAVPEAFADRIRALGARIERVEGDYEASVAAALRMANDNGWLLLADGSWEGYTERPALVMEGYTVLAEECRESFQASGHWPTHVFLQAGVGGLAAAVAGHIRSFWDEQPEIAVVEPDAAPCLLSSVRAGRLARGDGPPSNMGRLDCKDASLIAWDALRRDVDVFMTVSDDEASNAARLLEAEGIATTPSGAAGLAGLRAMQPGAGSRCLIIISAGPEQSG